MKSGKMEVVEEKGSSSALAAAKKRDEVYKFDEARISKQEAEKPWDKDARYFKECKISSLASMKMLKHALSGVRAAEERGCKPLEVMGLLLGKPEGSSIIIMDCFPLPVEGTETRVVADDEEVQAYMVNMSESLEQTRKERFIGWYHSHPFDVSTDSHCFFSSTDVSTQLMWQRVLDPKWVGIVVDPLRSLAKQEPQFGCFRCYPPTYSPPTNQCPDGAVEPDAKVRQMRWGATFDRYYAMEISYFMSSLGAQMLDVMSRNHLWIRVLASSPVMEHEYRQRFADRVKGSATKIESSDLVGRLGGGAGMGMMPRRPHLPSGTVEALGTASEAFRDLSIEQCQGHAAQIAKDLIFNRAPSSTKDA